MSPTFNYEHLDAHTKCCMGRYFQMFQMGGTPYKVCDRCDKPVKIRQLPVNTVKDIHSANQSGKVTENDLLNAAYLYGPGGPNKLPGPMQHPTPGNPSPPIITPLPQTPPAGPLTG